LNKTNNKTKTPALILGEIGLIHNLGEVGIPIYVGAEFDTNPSLYSRFAQKTRIFSSYESEKFIDELCEFGEEIGEKMVLLSDDDRVILNISENRKKLEPYYLLLFPDIEIVDQILDKRKFCDLAEKHNLPVPKTFHVSSLNEMDRASENLSYPCIIKPAYRHLWYHPDFSKVVGEYKKAYKCVDLSELHDLYKKILQIDPRVVVQEYVEGDDDLHFSVNMAVNSDDQIAGYFIARKLRVYPITAGMGCYIVTVKDDEIYKTAAQIVTSLKLRGLVNIQFKRDVRTGEPKLIEIHARNSVWSYLGKAAGMNLSMIHYNELVGLTQNSGNGYKAGVKYVNFQRDLRAFYQYHRAGEMNFVQWISSYFGRVVFSTRFLKDPKPFFKFFHRNLRNN